MTATQRKIESKTQAEATPGKPVETTDGVEWLNDVMVDAFVKSAESYVDWMAVWNREVADFMARRLSRQQDLARRLCKCEGSADVVECQRQWTMQAQQDYAEEFRKLTDLGVSFAQTQAAAAEKAIKANGADA